MCTVTAALMAVGTAVSAYGMIYQGQVAAQQGKLTAQAEKRKAELTQNQGAFEADRMLERQNRLVGTQISNASASGLQIDGSVTDVIEDSARESQLDIDAIRYNSLNDAANNRFNARIAKFNGAAEKRGAYIQAAGTALKGAYSIASSF